VEAGKKAATALLGLQKKVLAALTAEPKAAEALATAAGAPDEAEAVLLILEHLAANGRAARTGHGAAATFAQPTSATP
jgi:glucose-6-phosphate isomerase